MIDSVGSVCARAPQQGGGGGGKGEPDLTEDPSAWGTEFAVTGNVMSLQPYIDEDGAEMGYPDDWQQATVDRYGDLEEPRERAAGRAHEVVSGPESAVP